MENYSEETRLAILAFDERYSALRKQDREADLTPFLLAMLEEQPDEQLRDHISHMLQGEYRRHGNFEAATELALQAIAKDPLHPLPVLRLAEQKHYSEHDPAAALPVAIEAVAVADAAREYRRHARAVLLRIAAAVGNTDIVRKCLIEIMDMKFAPGEEDIAREGDLLVHARDAGVERDTLLRYRSFLGPVEMPITSKLPAWRMRHEEDE